MNNSSSFQDDRVIQDIHKKIGREKGIVQGAISLKSSTSNVSVQQKCDSNIREAQKNIEYLEERLRQLEIRKRNSVSGGSILSQSQNMHGSMASDPNSVNSNMPSTPNNSSYLNATSSNASFNQLSPYSKSHESSYSNGMFALRLPACICGPVFYF